MNDTLAAGYGVLGGPVTPWRGRGNVHFTRPDGPATVQIHAELSDGAAQKLDAFLRTLIAEDEAVLAALREADRQEAERQQMAAMARYQSMAQADSRLS